MPEVISCQQCQKKLRVPEETLGKKVKCPSCAAVFVAAVGPSAPPPPPPKRPQSGIKATPPPPPPPTKKRPALFDELEEVDDDDFRKNDDDEEVELEDDDDDRPRKRKRGRDEDDEDEDDNRSKKSKGNADKGSPRWRSVRDGIHLVAMSLLVAVGLGIVNAIIGWILGMLMSTPVNLNQPFNMDNFRSGLSTQIMIQSIISTIFMSIYLAMNVMGHQKIATIPDRKGVSTSTLANVTFYLVAAAAGLSLISNIAGIFLNQGMFSGNVNMAIQSASSALWLVSIPALLGAACWIGSFFTFLLVLRNICLAYSKKDLASTVMAYLISSVSVVLFTLIVTGIFIAVVGISVVSGFGGFRPGMAPNQVNQQAAAGMAIGVIGMMCFYGLILLTWLGMFIWYIILLFQVRGVLDKPSRN